MKMLIAAALPLLLVACASTSNSASNEPTEQKVYRTGSNLPVRDPEATTPNKTVDPSTIKTQPVPSLTGGRVGG
jgi:hypothetical protein